MIQSTFILFCSVLFCDILSIPIQMLYPFGAQHGDSHLTRGHDMTSAAIQISMPFPFFNNSHDYLFVSTKGDVTFSEAYTGYTPTPFPLQQNFSIIAAYQCDVDTTYGGDIWYRESSDLALLRRATTEIRTVFPQQGQFNATWIFVTTWNNVTFYGANEFGKLKRCTFQSVLVTDGIISFVMFIYKKIEWSGSGNKTTGRGGTPAQVGFDAGDGIHYYSVPASRTYEIINITQMSNIGIPGKFIFRVDLPAIQRPTDYCEYKGRKFQQGQFWNDGCRFRCTCDNALRGRYRCIQRCPQYHNIYPNCRLVPDSSDLCCQIPQCLPVTGKIPTPASTGVYTGIDHQVPRKCSYKGRQYTQGQKWRDGCDYNCQCKDASRGYYECTDICSRYNDIPPQCHLVTNSTNPCCKTPDCDFQATKPSITGTGTLSPNPIPPLAPGKLINECDNQTCFNNGSCVDLDGLSTWRCDCAMGYTGIHCETATPTPKTTEKPTPKVTESSTPMETTSPTTGAPTPITTDSPPQRCVVSKWSPWINRDKPDVRGSDHEEMTPEEKKRFCYGGNVTQIECAVDSENHIPYYSSGEIVQYCDKEKGIMCSNADNYPVTCSDYKIRYYCECSNQTDIDDCQQEPCVYGVCTDKMNDFHCTCNIFFYGKRCSSIKPWVIVAISGIMVVLICLFTCWCIRSSTNKRKSSKVKPRSSSMERPNAWQQ